MAEGVDSILTRHIDHTEPDANASRIAKALLTPHNRASIVPGSFWMPTSRKLAVNQSGLSSCVGDSTSIAELKAELVKLVICNIDALAHEKEGMKERRSSLIRRISLAEDLEQKRHDNARRVRIGVDVAVPPPDPPEITKRQSYRYHSRRGGYLEQASKKRKRQEEKDEMELDLKNGFRSKRWKLKEADKIDL